MKHHPIGVHNDGYLLWLFQIHENSKRYESQTNYNMVNFFECKMFSLMTRHIMNINKTLCGVINIQIYSKLLHHLDVNILNNITKRMFILYQSVFIMFYS